MVHRPCENRRASPPALDESGHRSRSRQDEYILGYKDRSAIVDAQHNNRVTPGGGVFRATIVQDSQVIGTWKTSASKRELHIIPQPLTPLSAAGRRALVHAAQRYGKFLGHTVSVR